MSFTSRGGGSQSTLQLRAPVLELGLRANRLPKEQLYLLLLAASQSGKIRRVRRLPYFKSKLENPSVSNPLLSPNSPR